MTEKEKFEFDRGYFLACCQIVNDHGMPEVAADALNSSEITRDQIKLFDLTEYDQKAADKILEEPRLEIPTA